MPVWNPDLPDPLDYPAMWTDVPDNLSLDNGFKAQWELFLRAAARGRAVPAGTCSPAPGASSWPSSPCAPRPRAGGSRFRSGAEMTARITLPGRAEPLEVTAPGLGARLPAAGLPPRLRRRPRRLDSPFSEAGGDLVDWEATLRFRDHLWAHGFAVAEAMDTAQRGMGLSWWLARELIASTAERAAARRARGPLRRPRLRGGHRPPRRRRAALPGGDHRRLRRAAGVRPVGRRRGDPDGEPRARRGRPRPQATTWRSTGRC